MPVYTVTTAKTQAAEVAVYETYLVEAESEDAAAESVKAGGGNPLAYETGHTEWGDTVGDVDITSVYEED